MRDADGSMSIPVFLIHVVDIASKISMVKFWSHDTFQRRFVAGE
jgi:hypothetical protein